MDFPSISTFGSMFSGTTLLYAAIALGAFIATVGFARIASERYVVARRMASGTKVRELALPGVTNNIEGSAPTGFVTALIPEKEDERRQVANALARAGFLHRNAVVGFYLMRLFLGFALPLIFCGAVYWARVPDAPIWLSSSLSKMSSQHIVMYIAVLCGVGFFGPGYWLNAKISKRKMAIEEAFPNMLDLLQIGVEAGMGFDQALLKVASEVQVAAPELAEEVFVLLNEIHAGRDRDQALLRMARRTGIDEISSFVNVVMQSGRFGTSLSTALTTYADEMRVAREMKAQEKANRLPVQLSAVMAFLLLPSLIALVLAPIVIRYVNTFG